jgi:HK97 family phage portal protein
MMAYLLVYGNGYAWIDRDDNGDPKQLLILDPESTWVTMSPLNEPIYHTRMGHKTFQFAGEDVFHLKDFGDGVVGDGLVHIARDSLGLSLALQRHACAYFRNGAAGGRVIELSPMLKDKEKLDQFKSEWRKVNSGADNGYKDKFVPPGTKLVPDDSRADAKESQLLECLEQDLIRVANLLNLPPHKMGANISTSYSSLQSENQAFLDDCLDNWLTLWSQEIWVKLLREREKEDDTRTVDYDRSELLRMDPKTEGELRIAKLNNGVISWEECRLLEDLPPEKDEEQEWRHASNITIESDEEEEEEVPPVQQLPPPQQLQQQTEKPPEKDAEKTAEPEGAQDAGSGTDRSDDKAKAMSLQAVERWLTRVRKSVEGGKKDVGAHKEVFMDHLGVWDKAEEVADGLISRMQAEIDAVLPEQVAEVFGRLDADKIAEGLWTTS